MGSWLTVLDGVGYKMERIIKTTDGRIILLTQRLCAAFSRYADTKFDIGVCIGSGGSDEELSELHEERDRLWGEILDEISEIEREVNT